MKRQVRSVLAGMALCTALVLGGCPGGGDSGYSLVGEVTDNRTTGGELAYIKLVAPGAGEGGAAIYSTVSTAFDAGTKTASYSMTGIAEGTYDMYVFVDFDGSGGTAPNGGDDKTGPDSLTFPGIDIYVILDGGFTWTTQ
jgi:hypothetical protein